MNAADMNRPSETNWAQVDALTDDTIDTSDIPSLTEAHFERMTLRMPRQGGAVTVNVDPNVLAWFKAQGTEFEQRINAALRIYAEAHQADRGHRD